MKQSEHVLYITLIDFLLQLLFLGLVIGVIYSAHQPTKEELSESKKIDSAFKKIKELTGISDLTVLTDELTRLGPLKEAAKNASQFEKIKPSIDKLGGVEEAEKVLKSELGKKGQGLPSCLTNGERVATFDAYSDKIVVSPSYSSEFAKLLTELGIPKEKITSLSLREFREIFYPVISRNKKYECVYHINLIEHSFDTRPRDAFIAIFRAIPQRAPDAK
jgi:hypothetical protein